MKPETPADRKSQRYLKLKIHSEQKIQLSEAVDAFWDAAIEYMGAKDLSDAEPWFIANKFDEENSEGVIRVNRLYEEDLRASLTLIQEIGGEEVFVSIEKVSGSVKNL
ncbi:MAG: Rpp14/Pop5 family protein [Candidatus Nanosalina sp.]